MIQRIGYKPAFCNFQIFECELVLMHCGHKFGMLLWVVLLLSGLIKTNGFIKKILCTVHSIF